MLTEERARPLGGTTIPKKQRATHEQFADVWANIAGLVSKVEIENLVDRTVEDIRRVTRGRRVAFAWSGGKDSQALEIVCRAAGVEPCVMAISDLEWPAFLAWVTDHMPPGLEILAQRDVNLDWLAKNPRYLFPRSSAEDAEWFKRVQWRAQERYYEKERLEMLIMGRRKADGNFMGGDLAIYSKADGMLRFGPIFHWRHEDVFAACHYLADRDIAPIYDWPRGFRVGTHSWPARQWTESVAHGFEETWAVSPDIVREAATKLAPARDWLVTTGRT